MTPEHDVVVVGAGPAGSATSAVLAARGRRVLLLEKDRFPRPKVCGEFLSPGARSSLVRLGALESVEVQAERIERGSVHLPGGRVVPFRLPAPALGISRFRLDELLARRAAALGAEVRFGARVVCVDGTPASAFQVRHVSGGNEQTVTARCVVGAWGRWDALDRTLERRFLAGRTKFLGWSRDYEDNARTLAGEVRLFVFRGGYCGLSRVEGGIANLAGVIAESARRRLGPGWEAVVGHARKSSADLDRALSGLGEGPIGFLGTGPIFFSARPPVEGQMLMVGDAAGAIDPFSGEGQAAALASGILAADTLELGLGGEIAIESVALAYAKAWKRQFSRRFSWGAAFRQLMLSPFAGALAARLGGEHIVRFAIARLSSRAAP